MKLMTKVKDMFSGTGDGYEYEEESSEVEGYEEAKHDAEEQSSYRSLDVSSSGSSSARHSKVMNINTGTSKLEVVVMKPKLFEEAREIAEHLNNQRTVVLNLELSTAEDSRRFLDFLSGVAFANHGEVKRVASKTFLLLPPNVNLMGTLSDDDADDSMIRY